MSSRRRLGGGALNPALCNGGRRQASTVGWCWLLTVQLFTVFDRCGIFVDQRLAGWKGYAKASGKSQSQSVHPLKILSPVLKDARELGPVAVIFEDDAPLWWVFLEPLVSPYQNLNNGFRCSFECSHDHHHMNRNFHASRLS